MLVRLRPLRQTALHAFAGNSSRIARLPLLERLMATRTFPTSFINPCQTNCNCPQYGDYTNYTNFTPVGMQEAGQGNTYQYNSRNISEKGKPEKEASYSVILPLLMV